MSEKASFSWRHRLRLGVRAAVLPFVAATRRAMPRECVWTIFAGHEVGAGNPHLPTSMRISVAALERRLSWAQRIGRVVVVREGLSLLAREAERLPLLSFSFDDAYRGVAEAAAPVLRKLGLRATLFVHTGTWDGTWLPWTDRYFLLAGQLGDRALAAALDLELHCAPLLARAAASSSYELKSALHREVDPELRDAALGQVFAAELGDAAPWARRIYLGPDELSALEDAFEIGSHGARHRRHALLDAGAQRAEIEDARAGLARALGHPVEGFAYPFGRPSDIPAGDAALLLHSGHAYACTMSEGANRRGANPYRLRRWPLEERPACCELDALVRGGLESSWLRR